MRALVSENPGGPETLVFAELPDPEPAPGEVRIRVESCGINYPDSLIIVDRYQARPPRPFSPGGEVSGIVDALGEDVTGLETGDRVAALTYLGGLAEKVCADRGQVRKVPPGVDGPQAAMLMSTYATAFHALVDRGGIETGETVLVLGAAGGTGSAAVQIAKALGARVVAGVSSREKAKRAREDGADEIVEYPEAFDGPEAAKAFARQLKEATGGADLIFDPVGGPLAEPALRAIAWKGRYLVVGFTAGIPAPSWNLPLLKGCSIIGVLLNEFQRRRPEAAASNIDRLFDLFRQGSLAPRIAAHYPFDEAPRAIHAIGNREAVGKIVVTMNSGTQQP